MAEKLLKATDVAARLNIPLRTVYAMLDDGGPLESLRISIGPRLIRVDPARFEEWVDNLPRGAAHAGR